MQKCCFDYIKPLQSEITSITDEADNDEPTVVTARNDGLINSQAFIRFGYRMPTVASRCLIPIKDYRIGTERIVNSGMKKRILIT